MLCPLTPSKVIRANTVLVIPNVIS